MRLIAITFVGVLAVAPRLEAQLRLETGGGQAHLDQLPSSSLTALNGTINAALGPTRLLFSGSAEDHFGLGVSGLMSGGWHYHIAPAGWSVDAGPVSEAGRGIGQSWVGTLAADLRVARDFGPVTLHAAWQQGILLTGNMASWRRPEIGAAFRLGSVQLAASWRATMTRDSTLRSTGFLDPVALVDTLYRARIQNIQDLGIRLAWSGGPLSLDGRVGQRFGANILPVTWWEGHAAVRLNPVMSLTMRVGRLASDALLGTRGGQYTTLGLQLELLQRSRSTGHRDAFAPAEIVRESPAMVHLYFALPPGTRRAMLAGDLTGWRAVELARGDDGRWEVVLPAALGVYRVNISTDGGPWRAPAGLPATQDGFGSAVGLLVLDR